MQITPIRTDIFQLGDSVVDFVLKYFSALKDGDILVVTSKIVALDQGRTDHVGNKTNLIKKDAIKVIETPWASMTLLESGWCVNAGVDEKNGDGKLILLPLDPVGAAEKIRRELMAKFCLKKLGVIITDTRSQPLRMGTVGRAIGWSGFNPIKSYIGLADIFGRKNEVTETNVADSLAAAAVWVMGEGDEKTPLAIIEKASVSFTDTCDVKTLSFPEDKDLYSWIYKKDAK